MSNYNPEFFSSRRLSERLVESAKDHLDDIGRPDLKAQLDAALFDDKKDSGSSVNFGDSRGWTV